jgi:hypothetical protein
MERIPGPKQSSIESVSERILTSEQVLEALSRFAEGFALGRELSDEKGVYLREIEKPGENAGETIEYQYMRKGNHGRQNVSSETAISVIYYENGMPVGGDRIAIFSEETGEWHAL